MQNDHRAVPVLRREAIVPEPRQRGLVVAALCLVAGTMLTLGIAPVLIATAADRAANCDAQAVEGAHVAWLGVRVRSHPDGARVVSVQADSPAASAGLHRGDVIVRLQAAPHGQTEIYSVTSSTDLVHEVRKLAPGNEVIVHVVRHGRHMRIAATLDAMAVKSLCRR